MLFNSFEFLLFLPCVLAFYWSLQGLLKWQNVFLLVASYFFYGWWDARFLFLIAVTTLVDYNTALLLRGSTTTLFQRIRSSGFLIGAYAIFVAPDYSGNGYLSEFAGTALLVTVSLTTIVILGPQLIAKLSLEVRRKCLITFSVTMNLGILAVFKYYGFFAESFSDLYGILFGTSPSFVTLNIVLPVGISFYTFQSMSYTIDVYRRELEATESFVDFAAYLSFFPQLVAGPIERGRSLLPQFQRSRRLTRETASEGVWLIAWGLFKKIVIADNLALVVNSTFNPYDSNTSLGLPDSGGFEVLVAVYAFAFQIYADFSGYSDIARGCAKLMGFELMVNFRLPYLAVNPSQYWQRWHISLSSWLRDYLYIPLGGNRGGSFKTYRNLTLTMVLGGLWHGASWNFVLWGGFQGLLLVAYRLPGLERAGENSKGLLRALHIVWFFHLTCFGWLIFRAQNLNTIIEFAKSIFTDMHFTGISLGNLQTLAFYIWPILAVQAIQAYTKDLHFMPHCHWFFRYNVWLFVLLSMATLGASQEAEFIYFAF